MILDKDPWTISGEKRIFSSVFFDMCTDSEGLFSNELYALFGINGGLSWRGFNCIALEALQFINFI
jgi:hypothetical protein